MFVLVRRHANVLERLPEILSQTVLEIKATTLILLAARIRGASAAESERWSKDWGHHEFVSIER